MGRLPLPARIAFRLRPGVRLLVSSRVSLPTVLGPSILVDVLPAAAALRLFRELWPSREALPDDAALARFVVDELGAHALSVSLAARLGDCYSLAELVQRWQASGTAMAEDPQDRGRLGSLSVSLRLTADALARQPGALDLWTIAALFEGGIEPDLVAKLESRTGWARARPALVRHHVLSRRGERWHMLRVLGALCAAGLAGR